MIWEVGQFVLFQHSGNFKLAIALGHSGFQLLTLTAKFEVRQRDSIRTIGRAPTGVPELSLNSYCAAGSGKTLHSDHYKIQISDLVPDWWPEAYCL